MNQPWETIEAFGNATCETLNKPISTAFLIVGHKITNLKPDDTVELDFVHLDHDSHLSVVVLSNEAWHPVWTKSSSRNSIITGMTLTNDFTQTYNKFYNVVLIVNGDSQVVWMPENELSRFNWLRGEQG